MFRSARRISLMSFMIVVLLAALWPSVPAHANPASFEFISVIDPACKPGALPAFLFDYAVGPNEIVYHSWTLENNRTGEISSPWLVGPIGAGTFNDVTTVAFTAVPAGTVEGDTLTERVEVLDRGGAVLEVAEISYYCGRPGCSVPIPETAVVGEFLGNTTTYWQPGFMTSPEVVIEVGKTAWTLGVDETGAFRKIIWACQYLWVPEGSMGPHFDEVWSGQPLPMEVVE